MASPEENLTKEQRDTKDKADREREAVEQAGKVIYSPVNRHSCLKISSFALSMEAGTRRG